MQDWTGQALCTDPNGCGQGGQGRGVARRVSVQRRHRIAPPPLLPFSHRRTFQRAITVLSLHSRCLNRTRREQNRGAWPPWAVQRNSLSAALQQGRRHCSVWAEHRRKHCLRHSLLLSLWHFSIFVVDFWAGSLARSPGSFLPVQTPAHALRPALLTEECRAARATLLSQYPKLPAASLLLSHPTSAQRRARQTHTERSNPLR